MKIETLKTADVEFVNNPVYFSDPNAPLTIHAEHNGLHLYAIVRDDPEEVTDALVAIAGATRKLVS